MHFVRYWDSKKFSLSNLNGVLCGFYPNPEIEIQHYLQSLHSRASCKIFAEPTGATQILHKSFKRKHHKDCKNSISGFGF